MDASYDPNFPPNLCIHPNDVSGYGYGLADEGVSRDEWNQEQSIRDYGIAGRVWDASFPVIPYLSASALQTSIEFDPPCSIFSPTRQDLTILELGSGQSLASMHLIRQLATHHSQDTARVYLTDLPEVIELCQRSADRIWAGKTKTNAVDVHVRPLPWGDMDAGQLVLDEIASAGQQITHILMFDLVYFPHLYPSLLRTLLQVTSRKYQLDARRSTGAAVVESSLSRVEVILSYKTRSLNFEQPFFHAFSAYFEMERLFSRPTASGVSSSRQTASKKEEDPHGAPSWAPHGKADDATIFICKRYPETLAREWKMPAEDEVMRGVNGRAADQRGQLWEEGLLGSIEWD